LGFRSGGEGGEGLPALWGGCLGGMLGVFGLYKGVACMVSGFSGWERGKRRMFCHWYGEFWGFYGRRLCVWRSLVDLLERVPEKPWIEIFWVESHLWRLAVWKASALCGLQHLRK